MKFFPPTPLTVEEINSVSSVWKARGMKPVLLAVMAAFAAWAVLLPVIPTAVLDAGGTETLAGLTTGVFMLATVLTQMATPALLRKFGFGLIMGLSSLLLGVPAFAYALGMEAGTVLTVSAIRGVGFGALTVAEAAVVAELVPRRLLGRATGTLGIMVGLSQMVGLPTGLALVNVIGYNAVYYIAAGVGLISLVACMFIPAVPQADRDELSVAHVHVPMWRLVFVPGMALMFVTSAYGAITNFLPAAMRDLDPAKGAALGGVMLGVMNFASMLSRYAAGQVMDRKGYPGSILIPCQFIAAGGVFLIALMLLLDLPVWWMALAALIYGVGFGAVQNEALTLMFYRLPRSKSSEASAIWNIAFDGGTGLGSTMYGMLLTMMMFTPMFGLAAAVILIGVVITLLDRQLGKHRVVEVNNLSVRLKNVQPPRLYRRNGR